MTLADERIKAALLGGSPIVGAKRITDDPLRVGAVQLSINGQEVVIPARAWVAMVAAVSDGGTTKTGVAVATMLHAGRPDVFVAFDEQALARVVLGAVEDMVDDDGNLIERKVMDTPSTMQSPTKGNVYQQ